MKQMVTLLIFLFTLSGSVRAEKDIPLKVSELPKKAQEFIKEYFPKNGVSYAKMEKDFWEKTYEVIFVSGEKIEFDKNGNWEKVKCNFSKVPDGIIPDKIRKHVEKQFPRAKILEIERNEKSYEVELDNQVEIEYNNSFKITTIGD